MEGWGVEVMETDQLSIPLIVSYLMPGRGAMLGRIYADASTRWTVPFEPLLFYLSPCRKPLQHSGSGICPLLL